MSISTPIPISPKSKKKTGLFCLFGFYLGLHAFYVGRVQRGFFYLFSFTGVVAYYSYILYFLSHHWVTSWLHFKVSTWFTFYSLFNIVVQHIPFFGWTAYFGSYLLYLFVFASFMVVVDFIKILCGWYKDSFGRAIVSQAYKQKLLLEEDELNLK